MTVDEAIKHCLEVAEENEELSSKFDEWDEWEEADANNCRECAADHRQLAEWLAELKMLRNSIGAVKFETLKEVQAAIEKRDKMLRDTVAELVEAKRLLKLAVKDFDKLVELAEYSDNNRGIGCIITDEGHHDECPLNDGMTCGWWHKSEALKLIGND